MTVAKVIEVDLDEPGYTCCFCQVEDEHGMSSCSLGGDGAACYCGAPAPDDCPLRNGGSVEVVGVEKGGDTCTG